MLVILVGIGAALKSVVECDKHLKVESMTIDIFLFIGATMLIKSQVAVSKRAVSVQVTMTLLAHTTPTTVMYYY